MAASPDVEVFSTCPASCDVPAEDYLDQVVRISQWSEQFGCSGMLVYTDNRLVDPWLVAQAVLLNTRTLAPLVALQPAYMHPYSAAKMVTTLAHLHGRSISLNLLAGGFRNDLRSLNDETPHDERYSRMVEYALIMRRLLEGGEPLTFEGSYYQVRGLSLSPALAPELFPEILSSGSSEAGLQAARAIGSVAVKYPRPPGEEEDLNDPILRTGLRVGVIARESSDEAWSVAHERFPEDRRGQLTHQLTTKVSDSVWHKQLSDKATSSHPGEGTYWLGPFQNYQTFCPYLVGDYESVSGLLRRYFELGARTLILDIPPSELELRHTKVALDRALAGLEG